MLRIGQLMALVLAGPALHFASVAATTAGIDPGANDFGSVVRRLTTALSPFTALGTPYLDPAVLRVAALQLVAFAVVWMLARRAARPVQVLPGAVLALSVMLAVTLVVPAKLGGVALTDIRFPVMMLCTFVAFSDVRLPGRAGALFAVAVAAAVLGRTVWLEARWSAHDAQVRKLLTAEAVLSPEDRVLVARVGHPWDILLHSHSASHLARRVGFFLPGVFSGGNALTARPEVSHRDVFSHYALDVRQVIAEAETPRPEPVPPEGRYWARWPEFYTHVLVLGRPGAEFPEARVLGDVVHDGSFFALYRTPLGVE